MAASRRGNNCTDSNRTHKLKSATEGVWDGRSRMRKQGGGVTELEGISEKVEAEGRVRRDHQRSGNRRTSRPRFEGQGRRKASSNGGNRREPLLKRERNSAARLKDPPEKAFALANLEAYLKERGPASAVKEGSGFSPSSRSLHARLLKQQLVKCPSNVSERNVKAKQRVVKTRRAFGSANEAADSDDTEAFHYERSRCGMPWHWPGNSSQRMNYKASFPVNDQRGGRRKRLNYKHNSERSVSPFDSESDTIPLMTEPEPFHSYSDDLADSSVEAGIESRMSRDCQQNLSRSNDDLRSNMPRHNQQAAARKQNSYKHRSLSQKYRPRSFKELIGQNMVAESLSNAILRAKIAPVYLFHGPRGTGKTTAAKIFTNAMNCLSIEELRPCGLCKECIAFNNGQNYDVKQVDAAGNNDVESMRLLLKLVALPPSSSRYKVFIVDDCHSLTAEAWNALLKSLEEPPNYVVFILITPDLEELPRTAISRCQKYMFPRVKDADIVLRLRKLALQERIEIELEALQFIASRSDGSFRDAENMLDQLSLLGNKVTLATVQEMVGLIPDENLVKLLELALLGNTVSTVNAIRELMDSGVEPLALTSQLATLITDILAGKDRAARTMIATARKEEQERLKQVLMILSEAEKQLRCCSDRTTWLTAAFLQFAPKESCHVRSISQGTSVIQSPITLLDTSEKETLDLGSARTRLSLGGDERWEAKFLSRKDRTDSVQVAHTLDDGLQNQTDNQVHHFSGPFGNNRIYPCGEQSPQPRPSKRENQSAGCAFPGTGNMEQRESSTVSPSTMESIWRKVLQGSRISGLKQILQGKGKLVSISVTEAFAIAYVEFERPEHKYVAERARSTIASAFQLALGCPVEVEFSLFSPAGDMKLVDRDSGEHPRTHVKQEAGLSQERRRTSRGSFRKSSTSFRTLGPATSSPLHQSLDRRRSRGSFEVESRNYSRRSTDRSNHEADKLYSSSRHAPDCRDEAEGESMPNGSENENEDSERFPDTDRDAPGALCWKGVKTSEHKLVRRQVRRRRRRGRFLLRLVPCAKGGSRN